MCDSIVDGVFMEIVCKNTIGKVVKCTKRRRTGDDEDFAERRTVLDHLKELLPMGYVLTKKISMNNIGCLICCILGQVTM